MIGSQSVNFKGNIHRHNTVYKYIYTVSLSTTLIHHGPVVQNPINANPRLKVNQGFHLAH